MKDPEMKQNSIVITITATPNGQVNVNGFPKNLDATLEIMGAANKAIVNYFVRMAMDGKVSSESSRIIKATIMPPKNLLN